MPKKKVAQESKQKLFVAIEKSAGPESILEDIEHAVGSGISDNESEAVDNYTGVDDEEIVVYEIIIKPVANYGLLKRERTQL